MIKRHHLLLSVLLIPLPALSAPIAVDDARSVPVNTAITIDVLNNDSDTNGLVPILDTQSITQPANGTITVNADGGITYTPDQDWMGTDSFNYSIVTNDGTGDQFATATVTIAVVPAVVNLSPLGPNVGSVAQAIDQTCNAIFNSGEADLSVGSRELLDSCNNLVALASADPEAAALALREIAPEETLALSKVGVNATQFQSNVVGARLMQLGQGLSAVNTGGLSWSGQLGAAAGDSGILAKFGYFASLQLEDADKDETLLESGFDYSATSLTAGIDYALDDQWFMGAALGYTDNQLDYKTDGGEVSSSILNVIGYSTYHVGNLSVDVQTGFGNSSIDLSRHIQYQVLNGGQFDAVTSGNTNGNQWFFSSEVQYLYSYKALTVYPALKWHYMSSKVDRYADTGAGGWDVVLNKQAVTQSTLQASLQATYAVNTRWGVWVPNIEFKLYDDLDTDQDRVTGQFAYATDQTIVFGMFAEAPDSLYYQIGAGFSVVLPRGVSGFLGYRKTLGYTDYSASQIQAGFRLEF